MSKTYTITIEAEVIQTSKGWKATLNEPATPPEFEITSFTINGETVRPNRLEGFLCEEILDEASQDDWTE